MQVGGDDAGHLRGTAKDSTGLSGQWLTLCSCVPVERLAEMRFRGKREKRKDNRHSLSLEHIIHG